MLWVQVMNTCIILIGYNWKGELIFTYGYYGPKVSSVINPRGICTDPFGHILVGDIQSNSVSMS